MLVQLGVADPHLRGAEPMSQRQLVRAAQAERPNDPWPRGAGHVPLGLPGIPERVKAYLEPGGSFSPAAGSFGISFWITDAGRRLVTTSDAIPLSKVQQRYRWRESQTPAAPAVETVTPFYAAVWQTNGTGLAEGQLEPRLQSGQHVCVVVRSVGPAGGPVTALAWSGRELKINESWTMTIPTPLRLEAMGDEGDAGWTTAHNQQMAWRNADGWGFARFCADSKASAAPRLSLAVRGPAAVRTSALPSEPVRSAVGLSLPDGRFAESLNAQVANLMMGLVRNETRPGEPMNYPLAWLRDGAYTLTALARSGRIATAQAIAHYFAEHDFFGGFGPEADAPGLSLWALGEVAQASDNAAFEEYLWTHVQRKAALILEMLDAKTPIYRTPYGPIVPQHQGEKELNLVCDPARDGLIMGRMDWHRPILFVNAVSYRGLLSAAALAQRLKHPERARQWQDRAEALRQAWQRAFAKPAWDNDRTYISGLWQTWIAGDDTAAYERGLQRRWDKKHETSGDYREKPLWTYFEIAEAHQWLLLNRSDRTWQTVNWFWGHQASPGLYTWWEGKGEENSFHGWENVRGWTAPTEVTPHYWSAAEMLLLQLDMLAYCDRRAEPVIVLGAGIPKEWLSHPMAVHGLTAGGMLLDWSWDGRGMNVAVRRGHLPVRLGTNFAKGTPLHLVHSKT